MAEQDKTIVDNVLNLEGSSSFALWQYYQDRADQIKERLWSNGTWLIAMGAAILAIPFTADLVMVTSDALPLRVAKPVPLFLIAVFGILVSIYSFAVVQDFVEHIESNWIRADYLKNNKLKGLRFSKPGNQTLNIILGLQLLANSGLALLALFA